MNLHLVWPRKEGRRPWGDGFLGSDSVCSGLLPTVQCSGHASGPTVTLQAWAEPRLDPGLGEMAVCKLLSGKESWAQVSSQHGGPCGPGSWQV